MAMVVGVFESLVNAQDAVADLLASGYLRDDIRLLVRDGEPPARRDRDPNRLAQPRGSSPLPAPQSPRVAAVVTPPAERDVESEGTVAAALETAGLEPAAARFFADAVCNGAVLVAVHCAAPRTRDAREILDVYNDSEGGPTAAQRRTLM